LEGDFVNHLRKFSHHLRKFAEKVGKNSQKWAKIKKKMYVFNAKMSKNAPDLNRIFHPPCANERAATNGG